MGPAPLTAIKNGETYVGYDTAFVFAEVNADYVKWIALRDDSGDIVFEGRCIYFQTTFCPGFMRCMHDMTTYVQQANERNGTLLQEVDYPENCQAHEESSIISSALNLIFAFVYIRRAKFCMNSVIKRVKFLLKCFKFVSR